MFYISQNIRISLAFTVANVATDPTTVSLTVDKPSGASTTYTFAAAEIIKDSVGNYHKDVTPATAEDGIWTWRGVGTGACSAATQGSFMVERTNV